MLEKSTGELLAALKGIHDEKALGTYLEGTDEAFAFAAYFSALLEEKGLERSDVVFDSGISRTYAYQILQGIRKPGREKVLALCIAAKLTVEETQRALTVAGAGALYPRHKRDAILLYALGNGLTVVETNLLLFENGQAAME